MYVLFQVNNLDEGPPIFTPTPVDFDVSEDMTVGSLLMIATATCPDDGVVYSVTTTGTYHPPSSSIRPATNSPRPPPTTASAPNHAMQYKDSHP